MTRFVLVFGLLLLPVCGCTGPTRPGASDATPMVTPVREASWKYPYGSGVALRSRHYCMYVTTDNRDLRARLPGFMEAAYQNYLRLTGLADRRPGKEMEMYVLNSRREWSDLTGWIFGQVPRTAQAISAGGYCYKGVGVYWYLGPRRTLLVASHEGLHQFLHHRMRHSLPVWVEEGFATNSEGFDIRRNAVVFTPDQNPGRFGALRKAIVEQKWVPIGKLLPMDAADYVTKFRIQSLGYYGQVWALNLFLRSSGVYGPGLKRMLKDAEAGRLHLALNVSPTAIDTLKRRGRVYNRTVARALFGHYITRDLDAFEQEYYAFAKKLAGL